MFRRVVSRATASGLILLAGLLPACAPQDTLDLGADGESASLQQALDHTPMWIGTRCQSDFQNNWRATWDNYAMCAGFNNKIDDTDTLRFYYNLHGAKNAFDNSMVAEINNGGVDSVDFFFFQTHGGFDSSTSRWTMWDQDTRAYSVDMRIGNDGRQAQVLATYSCDTLYTADGLFVTRWRNAFRGGLKLLLGAHGFVYNGADGKGADFATRLQNGEGIGDAWLRAVYYADTTNSPSFANTGTNNTNCWARAGATMSSVQSIPRIQDNNVGYYCWVQWN